MKLVSFIGLSVTALTLTFSTPSFADNERRIDVDSKVVTEHKARINGERFYTPQPLALNQYGTSKAMLSQHCNILIILAIK